ncbi:DegQ family serine endoprotease [Pelistega sp. NLN82]|uniref:Probable periplasmic serine endoprotease DegP-like n=1 Tax=Pelistega ratti TaxID=2652177 RepID=A0A6L9Y735_9BURK|nr:DegQ family serine endoprotease [Pelistega ratti]NEN75624.1 DegQ family serine endoprotease [Pelistega ratti]
MLIRQKVLSTAIALSLGVLPLNYAVADTTTNSLFPSSTQSSMGLPDFTSVVTSTEDSVVNIRTMSPVRSPMQSFEFGGPDDMFRFFFGPDFPIEPEFQFQQPKRRSKPNTERIEPSGVGSGFIISSDGYIITNQHVVDGASRVIVTLNNGKEYDAKVIGSDKRTDIALLKIDANNLKALPVGDSEQLKKGQWVLAIGSPYGLESTVTSGIVSAINRDTGDYLPFIQTDVAINPGNSGGPLIDLNGKVIGVNSQIYTRSGGFMGISFSIPINEAMKIVDQLKETGSVQRGRIGVVISEVKKEVADALGLKDTKGALVSNVEPNSPAEKSGIKSGDVIIGFNNQAINKWNDLPRLVGLNKPGTTTDIKIWRRGKVETLKITLDSTDPDTKVSASKGKSSPSDASKDRLGLTVEELTRDQKDELRISNGVLVTAVDGIAKEAGLLKDDVIMVVDNQDIVSIKQYQQIIKKLPNDKITAMLIRRNNMTQWITLTPKK